MSRLRVGAGLLITAAALVVSPTATAAQQASRDLGQALERHLDSLRPLLARAESAADAAKARQAEEARRQSAPVTDTFDVGPLRVVTLPSERALGDSLYREVWEHDYAPFVSWSPALAAKTFTFEWATPLQPIYIQGDARRVQFQRWRLRSTLVHNIRQTVAGAIVGDLAGTRVGQWAEWPVAPASDGAWLYRMMVAMPAKVDDECLRGDAHACWTALGLGLDAYPMDDWYSPEQRRAIVSRLFGYARERKTDPLWRSCVDDDDIASCDALLRGPKFGRGFWIEPLPTRAARAEMVWLALEAGGDGAWDRLRERPEMSPGEALAYASGLTRDQLASRWQAWLMAQRPPARATLDPSLLFTLLWMAVCAALAMRSTRWRLG
jgi:hypothetical protein